MNNKKTVENMESIIIERTLRAHRVVKETIKDLEEYMKNEDDNQEVEIGKVTLSTKKEKLYSDINIALNIFREFLSLCDSLEIILDENYDLSFVD